jgi:hypothetical protein
MFSISFSQRNVHTFYLGKGFFFIFISFLHQKVYFILQMHSESSDSFINILQILKSLKTTGLEVLYFHLISKYH